MRCQLIYYVYQGSLTSCYQARMTSQALMRALLKRGHDWSDKKCAFSLGLVGKVSHITLHSILKSRVRA